MSDKTLFFVQPFTRRRGKLAAGGALTYRYPEEALRNGVALARRHAGIVVLAQSYDVERQVLLPPRVLQVLGQVPAEWDRSKKAA